MHTWRILTLRNSISSQYCFSIDINLDTDTVSVLHIWTPQTIPLINSKLLYCIILQQLRKSAAHNRHDPYCHNKAGGRSLCDVGSSAGMRILIVLYLHVFLLYTFHPTLLNFIELPCRTMIILTLLPTLKVVMASCMFLIISNCLWYIIVWLHSVFSIWLHSVSDYSICLLYHYVHFTWYSLLDKFVLKNTNTLLYT